MRDILTRSSLLLAPLLFDSAFGYPTQAPLVSSLYQPQNYTGYELRRYGISNRQDMIHMTKTLKNENVDIWDLTPTHVDVHMDTTNPDLVDALSSRTYSTLPFSFPYNHTYRPVTSNSNLSPLPDVSSLQNSTFHTAYHTVEEIESFVVALASTYPRLVEVVWLGSSWENRKLFAIRIGKRGGGKKHKKGKKGKKGKRGARVHAVTDKEVGTCKRRGHTTTRHTSSTSVLGSLTVPQWLRSVLDRFTSLWGFGVARQAPSIRAFYVNEDPFGAQYRPIKDRVVIQGAQHAREWIATSTALYLAHALVAPRKEPGSLRHLLDQNDFTIIPVPNPDGYAYTWTTDRLWYKNRMEVLPGTSQPKSDDCKGVDMNRNWGYEWNSSSINGLGPEDPCSHWYPGAYPFQAPEVTAIADYIRRTPKIQAFVDLRSYGQKLMYPYSYSCDQVPPHAEDIIEAALGATKALRERHNAAYTSGASCELLYPAPGNIIDWMYGDAKVKYSYSLMLRDTGTYGFMLPPRWIQPVGEETASAIASLVKFIEDK